jgi:hypothetical protein
MQKHHFLSIPAPILSELLSSTSLRLKLLGIKEEGLCSRIFMFLIPSKQILLNSRSIEFPA